MNTAIKLVMVATTDFRRNEATQIADYQAVVNRLYPSQCICLISKTGSIMRFIFRPQEVEGAVQIKGKDVTRRQVVLQSRTYRILEGGVWNAYKLRNYAREVGLELTGYKLYEDHISEILDKYRNK